MLQNPWPLPPEQAARKWRRWTYDMLQRLPETLDHVEIHDGDLVMSPSPHVVRHQITADRIADLLKSWARPRRAGVVVLSPADVVLSPRRVVQPDVFFVARDRRDILGAAVMGAPDLVVEVLSPSTAEIDRTLKRTYYEDAGVAEYWLVDPTAQTVEILALGASGYATFSRGGAGETAASRLMDGLAVDVDDLFDPEL